MSAPKAQTMRKKIWIGFGCAALLSAAWFAWQLCESFRPVYTKIPHPQSEIYFTIRSAGETRRVEVTAPEDVEFLTRVFGQRYLAVRDDPICPFGPVTLTFEHDSDRIVFLPAADDCEFVRYGNARGFAEKLFLISTEDKGKLDQLWHRLAASQNTGRSVCGKTSTPGS